MKRKYSCIFLFLSLIITLLGGAGTAQATTPAQRAAIDDFLARIGGVKAPRLLCVEVDSTIARDGRERFSIEARGGKPCITGSTMSAATAGVNWYLNHYARINLAWNRPSEDFSRFKMPLPKTAEVHDCAVPYRYYLNYCTFSYSMSTWTWERWEREIDWMALHGVNMPLQIVGLDVLWRNILTRHYGYSPEEAAAFIAGPCFQAWWGMNNIEGWGGPNPEWWYERQYYLANKILERQRQLGIEPVLPGYSGMVPSNFQEKTGIAAIEQGTWCGFTRPYILDPNSEGFAQVSRVYYDELEKLMGQSAYYSMDPFHEGARTSGVDVPAAYRSIRNAMVEANPAGKWVIQQWQWSKAQRNVLDQVEPGRLIVLDLFSDGNYHVEDYKDHETVYCSLANFGGRTGLFGRLNKMAATWQQALQSKANVKGIGSAAEAIEQVPVNYDLLFELPWMATAPDMKAWIRDYARARYGKENKNAEEAWEIMLETALNCTDGRQGPHEAIMCARPALKVKSASSWGSAKLFYDPLKLRQAARKLLNAKLQGNNYTYDLIDITRQVLTDYSIVLLDSVRSAHERADSTAFNAYKSQFLGLIEDVDALLACHPSFMVGEWTQMARDIADEMPGIEEDQADWLELNNARTLITTWGARRNSEKGGLRDYSYRQKSGILRDLYLKRWQRWFDAGMPDNIDWFQMEWDWAHNASLRYPTTPNKQDIHALCASLMAKYLRE